MNVFALPATALAAIGRHGTLLVAGSVFVGLFVPEVAAAFKPYLGETIFIMLCLAFLRVDAAELRRHWSRPGLILAATFWVMLVAPTLSAGLLVLFGVDQRAPGLFFILVLQMAAPGLMSSPALAALMGLDVALTLGALIVTMAVAPFTASAFSNVFLGTALASPLSFGLKLLFMIVGSAAVAAAIRKLAGRQWVEAQRERIDGLSVLAMFLFAVAAMDGVADRFRADPLQVAALTALAFALSLGLTAITTLVFLRAGRTRALAIGLLAGNRNIGLMMAATGFMVPDVAWLYFALAQFPIYLLPHLLKPLITRLQQST